MGLLFTVVFFFFVFFFLILQVVCSDRGQSVALSFKCFLYVAHDKKEKNLFAL